MMRVTKHFEHLKIQLESIISATNNFADENCVGKGGFGKVYKGELVYSKGQTVVAIKRLNRAFGQGDPEFWKEIIMLSRYKHENIVSLLGFCDDSGEKILVYEYASNKSLDLHLNSNDLTWIQRLKICIGAARGLAYLHDHGTTQQRILHRDIKSSNILLDETWNARISDFGLSKFAPANQQISFMISNGVGTIGYCDPIYVETGLLTKESDVYSFGVVLFEVLCGRLCIGNNDKRPPLPGLARQCYKQNKLNEIIYGNIKDEINSDSLKAFSTIAYQCLERDIEKRPSMAGVVRVLESALEHQDLQYARNREVSLKVRKEKLGDRIAALQQLVAPTDTASVLTEAIEYINFLHNQVETLSVPYMKSTQKANRTSTRGVSVTTNGNEEATRDLRSRGLCLVPLSTCLSYVTDGGGGIWSGP